MKRKDLQGETDAELDALLSNALSDLLTATQPPVYLSSDLDKDPPPASAEVIHDSDPEPSPFTKRDEAESKMYFDFLNGRCVPGKGVN